MTASKRSPMMVGLDVFPDEPDDDAVAEDCNPASPCWLPNSLPGDVVWSGDGVFDVLSCPELTLGIGATWASTKVTIALACNEHNSN